MVLRRQPVRIMDGHQKAATPACSRSSAATAVTIPAWAAARSYWWQELNDGDHNGDDLGRRGVFPGGQVMQRRTPSSAVVKILAEATMVLVLFSDASRIGGLHPLRATWGCACGCWA